ncbi:unnamed protein product [Hyaloperonospora brassicae]|uniref:Uncharacterized protein n=1 Tax=Hyaloperonospora brassicae TaxID=162125 RepID=A0AAV0UZD0_HYABA|nr:unnamed protein product [Hyaloperonospora brassicae]
MGLKRQQAMDVAPSIESTSAFARHDAPPQCHTPLAPNVLTSSSSLSLSLLSSASNSSASSHSSRTSTQDNATVPSPPPVSRPERHVASLTDAERRLERESATDFRLGRALLLATRRARVAAAHAALARRRTAAHHVLLYASEKARAAYARRCGELQRAMNADMERELRRLQTAKDGVSVTSRRRRAVRDDARRSGVSVARSAASGLGVRRRRSMYTSEEDEDEDDRRAVGRGLWATTSGEEQAHRAQLQEKKWLERLLGRASVFQPVVQHVAASEVAEDLETIQSALSMQQAQVETTGRTTRYQRHKAALQQQQQQHVETNDEEKEQVKKPKRQRRMMGTPRAVRDASRAAVPASMTPVHRTANTAATSRRPRLHYNPHMLQEGQEIEVLKRRHTKAASGRERQDECVLSGTITAATATQVYVLTASGRFESFDVRDCIRGVLYVRAAAGHNSLTHSVQDETDASSAMDYTNR